MVTFRKAVIMAAVLLFMIFMLYPRHSSMHTQRAPTSSPPSTAAAAAPPQSPGSVKTDTTPNSAPPITTQPKPTVPKVDSGAAKVQQKLALAAVQNLPIDKQLAYHFPYSVSSKFPAYIWQTWKYTPASGQFADKFRVPEASWTEKHPSFVHEVITDDVAEHLIRHLYSAIPDVLEAYLSMPLPILKADFFRYLILLARGGVYADIDTQALKPTTEWVPQSFNAKSIGLVIGIEADPDRADWAKWYSRRIQFCQWTIKAKPGHPVLVDIVTKITAETLKRKREGNLKPNHDGVVEWTGPAVWTDSIFSYFNDPNFFETTASAGNITFKNFTGMRDSKKIGDVVVLPITSFSPGIGHSGAGPVEDPMAFVKHEFEGSWKPATERIIEPKPQHDANQQQQNPQT
ncbi:nucleotide-diphospho-sugar transferase [Tricharina praecox]|uniref:nucleotide-diphospho-sugar transferase n=1 Tax=Tricharina praecox TaxID=43433 RepID=UPI002220C6C6|nr:nucleotide-diphospho-sugar transferase [Tricharina praecox]KAI5856274.1 nucleotide-diphospho-sugar transferase [Tricharina praecox]